MPSLSFLYLQAKASVVEAGYSDEIRWQAKTCPRRIDEPTFLSEAAWVILSAGMREAVIRRKFSRFSDAFYKWQCARSIWRHRRSCANRARNVFAHDGKIAAILTITEHVAHREFAAVLQDLEEEGTSYLMQFPYLGPATSFHLAKNLGVDVVKPDRHLIRIAHAARFRSPSALCDAIAREVGDRLAVIDVVLWRFATIYSEYESYFSRVKFTANPSRVAPPAIRASR